ncbi:hypothetical protein N2152v2_000805 [Parachlorella kessleri]
MSCPFKHLWGAAPPPSEHSVLADGAADGALQGQHPVQEHSPAPSSPATGCPFGHGKAGPKPAAPTAAAASGAAAGAAAAPPANGAGRCPFGHGSAADSATTAAAPVAGGPHQQANSDSLADTIDGVPPLAQHSRAAAHTQQQQAQQEAAADTGIGEAAGDFRGPAVCPLGFGGGALGPRMTELHCVLCRQVVVEGAGSLLHDCVVSTSCGHRFCSGCIERFEDCPLCGADIVGTEPDPEIQRLVDHFVESHADDPATLRDLEETSGAPELGAAACPTGGLLLQLGLRAMGGGNLRSARDRFEQCRQRLLWELDSQGQAAASDSGTPVGQPGSAGSADERPPPGGVAASSPQQQQVLSGLGAVCGCLGDCCRAAGDWEAAAGFYEESAEHLQRAGGSQEAQQSLSVTLNKLGELHHVRGNLPMALDLYRQSLAVRRGRLQAALDAQDEAQRGQQGQRGGRGPEPRPEPEWAAAALDVAVGCLKVADALQASGEGPPSQAAREEAQALNCEAAELSKRVDGSAGASGASGALPAPLLSKLGAVQAHLAAAHQGAA